MPLHKLPFQSGLPAAIQGLKGKEALSTDTGLFTPERVSATPKQINQYQSLLTCYGITTEMEGENFIGECPFEGCTEYQGKSPKFSMNIQTGMFRCFRCGISGNSYGFIRAIHHHYLARTTSEDYESLIKMRKNAFGQAICEDMQLAYNTSTKEWMLPSWGRDGLSAGIVNLYVYRTSFDPETRKPFKQIRSGPTFKQHAYGVHRLRDGNQRPIVVLEGHWDYLAFCELLSATKQTPKFDCIGKPGSAFPKNYLSLFNGRDVRLMMDNDPAGEQGVEQICRAMTTQGVIPTSLWVLKWPEGLPKGFDVSDVITHLPQKYHKAKVKK
jgi:hypothetical protein